MTGRSSIRRVPGRTGPWAGLGHRPAHPGNTLSTCHEISDRKHLADELIYWAGHDPLTGLVNRARFIRRLDTVATGHPGDADDQFAVLFVDLDNFKPVNDIYGHATGDEVLRILGARLRAAGCTADLVARLGGDEFALILTYAKHEDARRVAARLLRVIHGPIATGGTVLQIDATIGVAVAVTVAVAAAGDQPSETVARDADRAIYQGKESGRGRPARPRPAQPMAGNSSGRPPLSRSLPWRAHKCAQNIACTSRMATVWA